MINVDDRQRLFVASLEAVRALAQRGRSFIGTEVIGATARAGIAAAEAGDDVAKAMARELELYLVPLRRPSSWDGSIA